MKSTKRTLAALFVSSAAAALAHQAHAQVAAPTPPAPGADSGSGLQQVIVTAERRSVNMQKVPVAVTAVTARQASAAGVSNVSEIQSLAPSVNIAVGIGGANVAIRGISSTGSTGDEPANAIYVDGVYNPVLASLIFGLNNVQSIEIDKGPQGTLFGRNTTGGAIQVVTKDPQQHPLADITLGYGNYDTYTAQGYFSGGITNNLSADLAVYLVNQNQGWGHDITTATQEYKGYTAGLRTKWKWTPDDKTSVLFTYTYNRLRPQPDNGNNQVLPGEGYPYAGFYNSTALVTESEMTVEQNFAVTVKRDLGFANLTDIASYDFARNPIRIDILYNNLPGFYFAPAYKTTATTITNEVQLQSKPQSPIAWTVGTYFYDNTNFRRGAIQNGATFLLNYGRSPTTSWAGYGQVTVPVFSDATHLTGGVRYTNDSRTFYSSTFVNGHQTFPALPLTAPFHQHEDDSRVTWRVALDHNFTEDLLGYASIATGYKSGFYNISAPNNTVVLPEDVTAYEVGFKSELFEHRLRMNASLFYDSLTQIQTRGITMVGPIFNNAAAGWTDGLDVDFQARPVPQLQIQGGFTLMDTRYTSYKNALFFSTATGKLVQIATPPNGAAGNQFPYSPKFAASLLGQYTFDLGSHGSLVAAIDYYFNGGMYFEPQNRLKQPAYSLVNSSLTWSPNAAWSVMLWGKNLSSARRYESIGATAGVGDVYIPEAPLTFGATVRFHYE